MDVVSHGLWGGVLFGRKSKTMFWSAFAFGVAPDVLSFGIYTVATALGFASRPDWSNGPPPESFIPSYVDTLYNITHSFIPFIIIFGIVWAIRKKPFLPMLAWAFHILLDIPTHTTAFFSTPFLWPFSHPHVNGISWSHPLIFFPNWIALIAAYGVWWYTERRKSKNGSTEIKK